jgi:hypothetical protein
MAGGLLEYHCLPDGRVAVADYRERLLIALAVLARPAR